MEGLACPLARRHGRKAWREDLDPRIEIVRRALDRLLPGGFSTRDQKAVTLSDSEPEPDITIVSGAQQYDDHHPGPSEIALIAEIANTTLDFDRKEKGPIFSQR